MNIKKIMIGAAFCAALSVLPACGGGGGGGSNSGESQDAGGSSSGNAEDYAPSDLVGKRMSYNINGRKNIFSFSSNGKLNATINAVDGKTYYHSGTYTYKKVRANNANLHIEYNGTYFLELSNGTYIPGDSCLYVNDVGLTFSSPSAAYAFMKRYSIGSDGKKSDTNTYGGSVVFE